jgi:hypothetical protein
MITVEATDSIVALDLVQRLRRYHARSSPLDGVAQEVVIERVPREGLREILAEIRDWGYAFGLETVALRSGGGSLELRLDRDSGLAWHEVG